VNDVADLRTHAFLIATAEDAPAARVLVAQQLVALGHDTSSPLVQSAVEYVLVVTGVYVT
jgi:hypothetical protein